MEHSVLYQPQFYSAGRHASKIQRELYALGNQRQKITVHFTVAADVLEGVLYVLDKPR